MSEVNVWICPASYDNLKFSIMNTTLYDNKQVYMWALNARRKNSWNKIKKGDICIFGGMTNGWKYFSRVSKKIEINQEHWPFKSPTMTLWKYGFTLDEPNEISITGDDMRRIMSWNTKQCWQTQTLLSSYNRDKILELLKNYGHSA